MTRKVDSMKDDKTGEVWWWFWCPGCESYHAIPTPRWEFNNNPESPTFHPSYRVKGENNSTLCHLFIKNGQIEFCNDCPHSYAGRTVQMPEFDWDAPGGGVESPA